MVGTEISSQRYRTYSLNSNRSNMSNGQVSVTSSRKNSFGLGFSSFLNTIGLSSNNPNTDISVTAIDNNNIDIPRSGTKLRLPSMSELTQAHISYSNPKISYSDPASSNVSPSTSRTPSNQSNNPFQNYSNYTTSKPSSNQQLAAEPQQKSLNDNSRTFKLPEPYMLPILLPLSNILKPKSSTGTVSSINTSDSKAESFSTSHYVNDSNTKDDFRRYKTEWNISQGTSDHENPCAKNVRTTEGLYSIRLTTFIDPSIDEEAQTAFVRSQGLYFDPIIRTAGPDSQLIIARYMESFAAKHQYSDMKLNEFYRPILFKSNVVSRLHGCLKIDESGNWYIKDFNSSSGTFLNHKRICSAKENGTTVDGMDCMLHDGDVIQLGMDFNGGTNQKFRCVKVKVELNLSWKLKAKNYKKLGLEKLHTINTMNMVTEETNKLESCSICLDDLDPCQGIFISPCGHTWHFNCIRRLLLTNYPQFICPNCRATTDLEASMDNLEVNSQYIDHISSDISKQQHVQSQPGVISRASSPCSGMVYEETNLVNL